MSKFDLLETDWLNKSRAASGHHSVEAETIDVDGVQRPVTNSTGSVIHPTAEGTRAFWRWFGESKAVDNQGRPIVVFHGGSFSPDKGDTPDTSRQGMFFTADRELAQSYAKGTRARSRSSQVTEAYVQMINPFDKSNERHLWAGWLQEWIDFWREEDGWIDRATGAEMSNADVVSMIEDGRLYEYDAIGCRERWHDFLATLREHHDGYIGADPTEAGRWDPDLPVIYVAFDPEQIRINSPELDADNAPHP